MTGIGAASGQALLMHSFAKWQAIACCPFMISPNDEPPVGGPPFGLVRIVRPLGRFFLVLILDDGPLVG